MKTRTYILHGCRYREEEIPDMYVVVSTYTPSSCPWDGYGRKHLSEYKKVLAEFNPVGLHTSGTLLNPAGTGANGRVRLGDAMTPGLYRVAVPKKHFVAAIDLIAEHKKALDDWCYGATPMLVACRGN